MLIHLEDPNHHGFIFDNSNLWEPVAAEDGVDLSSSWHLRDPGSQSHLNRERHFPLNSISFDFDFGFPGHTRVPQLDSTFCTWS